MFSVQKASAAAFGSFADSYDSNGVRGFTYTDGKCSANWHA